MHDLHIGDFYNDTARILVALYKRFPVKSALYIEDISGPDNPDEFGLHSPRHMACFSTAQWLAEEGYIRYSDTIQQHALDETVLSQSCFLFFTSVEPDAGATRISIIKRLIAEKNSAKLCDYLQTLLTKYQYQSTKA